MGWIQKLYETYENCQSMIGSGREDGVPLLPICHTTQKAQIEIAIDQEGNFKRARLVPNDDSRTIVPCTESSGGRTGIKPVNHPLCDKLQYVAGDFVKFGGKVTSGYAKNPKEPHESYVKTLMGWCESKFSHPKAIAVQKYIGKGCMVKDLIDSQILSVGLDGKLLEKWAKKTRSDSSNSRQDEAFVRWIVEIPKDPQTAVWKDASLFESWIKYDSSLKTQRALCYVTGTVTQMAEQHPYKLRNEGDKAKIISSNDITGFTFRGRFLTSYQACGVGFEVTQKAHNALRWLISRQGTVFYEGKGINKKPRLTIVAWATSGDEIPDPLADPFSILGFDDGLMDSEVPVYTAQDLAIKLNKKIIGYSAILGDTKSVVVMGLDSATPGRMAITFYRELSGADFLDRIDHWHKTCCWVHDYHLKKIVDSKIGKEGKIPVRFVGAPAPSDITRAAYGNKIDDKLRRSTVERILPCIIDGQDVPRDIVELAFRRAVNRVGMEEWEWNKTLSIACALYKKYHEKEEFALALEVNRKTREYLYGRLLALADCLEKSALNKAGEKRQTTAARLMNRFADHPFSTWRTIEIALAPYKARLGGASFYMQKISEVMSMFEAQDFINDKSLNGEFLLGYHCQRDVIWKKSDETTENVSTNVVQEGA